MEFKKWLEAVDNRVNNQVIDTLKKAKDRIGQFTSMDFRAATEADALLRGVRGYLRMAQGPQANQEFIFNLTRLANSCNHLSHLDPQKREKINQIQADIDGLISQVQSNLA